MKKPKMKVKTNKIIGTSDIQVSEHFKEEFSPKKEA